jgi:hypothetical protein
MSTSIDFATLKEAVRLSTIVSETVQLKRCGRQQWNGLCPFHNERTPSFYVYDDTRAYHCFGCGAHGDAMDWLQRARGLSLSDAVTYLGGDRAAAQKSLSGDETKVPKNFSGPLPALRLPDPDALRKLATARRTWTEALPPHGTPVEIYLAVRGVHLPDADVLRWHPRCPHEGGTLPAMVALMTEPVTDEFRGIHRTFLKADGTGKADVPKPKMMLGGSGIIQLADLHDIGTGLALAEGLETALSVMQVLGWGPVWAAGSAGGIRSFPFLPATTLNIFTDPDKAGLEAARDCRDRWAEAGGEVFIHEPPAGRDWNDVAGSISPCP